MADQVQKRRGTATEHNTFTGAVGEVTVNTTNDSLHVHDGATAGGFETLRVDMDNYDGTRVSGTFNVTDLDVSGDATVDGSLGIGTSNPLAPLDVESATGNVGFNYGTSSSPERANLWYDTDGTGWKFNIGKVQSGSFTSQVTIQDNGRVGIGTSSPSTDLHVSSSTGAVLRLQRDDTGITTNDSLGSIEFYQNDPSDQGVGVVSKIEGVNESSFAGYGALAFSTGSATSMPERMRIDSSGNVNIYGTDNRPLAITSFDTASAGAGWDLDATSGNGVVTVSTGGSERLRIDSLGNVGIGASSPTASAGYNTLSLNGSNGGQIAFQTGGTAKQFIFSTSTDLSIFNQEAGNIKFTTNSAERMRIDSSGNVGIGGITPSYSLDVSETGSSGTVVDVARIYTSATSTASARQVFGTAANTVNAAIEGKTTGATTGNLLFYVDNSGLAEAARIDASGNLLVGKSASSLSTSGVELGNGYSYFTSSGINQYINRTSDGETVRFYRSGTQVGSISVTGSATAYNTSSDARLKDNIVDAPSASDDIDAIQVRSFDWKADGSHQKYGMVAQELQSVAPEAVSEGATEEDMMGVDYSKLVPMLVKEIQSLRARVAQLEGAN